MEYSIGQLARLSGVSTRTLRHYDQIGLLAPARVSSTGYRIYGAKEVDALQQILFFRELGLELAAIRQILEDPGFYRLGALERHLAAMEQERARLGLLIGNLQRTIAQEKGGRPMCDQEKFEGMKHRMLAENERQYGQEIRERYGEETVEQSNAKFMGLSQQELSAMEQLSGEILNRLHRAVESGVSPDSPAGQEIAALHRQWLGYTWPSYSAEAHRGLCQMYLDDSRFTAYYDKEVPGCARFLRDAVEAWTRDQTPG